MLEDSEWFTLISDPEIVTQNEDNICYNETELEVNTNYTFSIRMRSSLAPPHDDYWSPYYTATFQTKPLIPTDVPETDMSLFRIHTTKSDHFRDVSIFWKPMNFSRLYEDSFHYEIKVYKVGEDGSKKIASKMQPKYKNYFEARYKLGPSAYQFVIRSANSEGKAKNASSISIPAAKDEVKINLLYYYISYLNRTCDYIWQPTKDNLNIVNYTFVQFSYLKDAHGNVLNNDLFIHLIHLPANVTRYRLEEDMTNSELERYIRTYVSANTNKSSTGFIRWLFRIIFVTDYFKSEKYVKKVKKVSILSKALFCHFPKTI